jgi:anti-sigma-K factor RskA
MTCADFSDRIEDYLNGSLTEAQARELERHAELCPTCREQIEQLGEGAALVWLTVTQVEPPIGLRERVMAAVRSAPVPTVAGANSSPPALTAGRPVRRLPWRVSLTQFAAALSALALALALALGGWVAALQGELNRQALDNARLRDQLSRQRDALYVLMSPTLVERPLAGGEGAPYARGRAYLDPTRRQGMVVASDLPQPEPGRVYQVWLRGKDGVVSAGLLRLDDRGTGYALLEPTAALDQFETIGISLEPAGGSPQPTGTRMLSGTL